MRLSHVTQQRSLATGTSRITDILEGPLAHNPAALTETLLHTKFLKRLGGFFRCDPGEKGYYGHLSWTPQNCSLYNRVASQMMRVLLCSSDDMDGYYMGGKIRSSTRSEAPFISRPTSPTLNTPRVEGSQGVSKTDDLERRRGRKYSAGIQFLRTDRRGKLVFEIIHHIMEMLSWVSKGGSTFAVAKIQISPQSNSRRGGLKQDFASRVIPRRTANLKKVSSVASTATTAGSNLVFSRGGVLYSMCREYFMILGLLSKSTQGLQLLAEAGLFSPESSNFQRIVHLITYHDRL